MWGDMSIAFLLAFITAYVITPYTIRLSKKIGALDFPSEKRKIHTGAIPRLGGLAVITGFTVSTIYLLIVMNLENTLTLGGYDNYGCKLLGFFLGAIVLSVFCFMPGGLFFYSSGFRKSKSVWLMLRAFIKFAVPSESFFWQSFVFCFTALIIMFFGVISSSINSII